MKQKKILDKYVLYLMLLPAFVYLIVFRIIPIIEMKMVFYDYKIVGDNVFVGFKYFKQLFDSVSFNNVLKNTLIISTMKMIFIAPIPIIISLIYSELINTKYLKFVQTTTYLPHLLSWVVIAGIFTTILSPDGLLNTIQMNMGASPTDYLTSKGHIRWILVFSEMWRSCGWDTILYTAAILKIDGSLYEAATIDGASRFKKMRYITLPHLKTTIITIYILNLGFFMSAGLDQVLNFTNDSVLSSIDIIDTFVYRVGLINANYSLGTAASIFKGVIGAILIVAGHKIVKRISGKGIW